MKIEVNKIRPIQRDAYLKMAECYNSGTSSSESIERCAFQASQPSKYIQQIVENEMSQLNGRLQRCGMSCQDEVRDKYTTMNSDAEKAMKNCLNSCADKHIAMLKSIKYNIESKIDEATRK